MPVTTWCNQLVAMWSRRLSQYFHAWRRRGRRERRSEWQKQSAGGVPARHLFELLTEEVRGGNLYQWAHSKIVSPLLPYCLQIGAILSQEQKSSRCSALARFCATCCFCSCTRRPYSSICSFQGASIHAVVKCVITIVWRKHNNYRKQLQQGAPSHVATTGCTWLWADLHFGGKL